jgi:hypothetical protein
VLLPEGLAPGVSYFSMSSLVLRTFVLCKTRWTNLKRSTSPCGHLCGSIQSTLEVPCILVLALRDVVVPSFI